MAYCETVAFGKCAACAERVAVKRNRSGMAYYRCDSCGVQLQHHSRKVSDKYLSALGVEMEPAAAGAGRQQPEKKAAAAAPAKARGGLGALFDSN